jgi:hypothetical protein
MTQKEKLKELITRYGKLTIGTHIFLSFSFYIGTYLLLSKGVDMNHYLKKINLDISNKTTKTTSNMLAAYIIYKVTMPIRIPVTMVVVPFLAKFKKI